MFSDEQRVSERTVTELGRSASAAVERVGDGERVVVTRHGRAVAVLLSLDDAIAVMLAGSERFALLRREAREELERGLGEVLEGWRATRSG